MWAATVRESRLIELQVSSLDWGRATMVYSDLEGSKLKAIVVWRPRASIDRH